ncbi:hypothetical protein HBH56_222220 [Parastagonospora nodorum]|uniref:Uncharacterized protein n=2 Tax=Phaeosphaeria nodorum (strain SN15 / ATCC MYA-4574 / FGSC 10173) TaxID=321614 RepID=A0A7U2F2K1_PHANO|nr:hypothetical protein HBH56_222220 [Parastagonospora nodorum]QRC97222.1 hypothetical protein JI435_139060 [Parastagonospora nodorum SN15]KAH3924115.1 hypothetical protein HBH54_199540 [Parastagonospora nodorum]KAH3944672.1 hypothetical protein HBH53_155900 [Parastagonospora nodorum]KAH3963484.1 hypothetical protein HBH51_168810 [Parastagonospora nodorum]
MATIPFRFNKTLPNQLRERTPLRPTSQSNASAATWPVRSKHNLLSRTRIPDMDSQYGRTGMPVHSLPTHDANITRAFPPDDFVHMVDANSTRQLAFSNVNDANDWLHISLPPPMTPNQDTTISFVDLNRAYFVRELVDAVYDLRLCMDGPKMRNHFLPHGNSYFSNLEVEAACHVLLDRLIELCQTGFRGLRKFNMHTLKRCPDADKTANCFTRYTNTLNALRTWKSICKGMIEEDAKKWQLVNAPLAMIGRKKTDKRGNRLKKDKIDSLEARMKDEKSPELDPLLAYNAAATQIRCVEHNDAQPRLGPMVVAPIETSYEPILAPDALSPYIVLGDTLPMFNNVGNSDGYHDDHNHFFTEGMEGPTGITTPAAIPPIATAMNNAQPRANDQPAGFQMAYIAPHAGVVQIAYQPSEAQRHATTPGAGSKRSRDENDNSALRPRQHRKTTQDGPRGGSQSFGNVEEVTEAETVHVDPY